MKHLKLYEAQQGGEPKRVKLKVDLTEYDDRLIKGSEGSTIPWANISMYGKFDTFVAVKFDCGAKIDVAINSLEYEGEYINEKDNYNGKKIWKLPFQDKYFYLYLKKIGHPSPEYLNPSNVGWNLADEDWIYIIYDPSYKQPWKYSFVRKRGYEMQELPILDDIEVAVDKFNL